MILFRRNTNINSQLLTSVDFGQDERDVVRQTNLAVFDRLDRRGATLEESYGDDRLCFIPGKWDTRRIIVVPTGRAFLRRGIYGLPATVTFREIRPSHPGLHPDVKIPNGVLPPVRIEWIVVELIILGVVVSINGQRSVGIVSGHEIGNWTGRNPQRSAYWTKAQEID